MSRTLSHSVAHGYAVQARLRLAKLAVIAAFAAVLPCAAQTDPHPQRHGPHRLERHARRRVHPHRERQDRGCRQGRRRSLGAKVIDATGKFVTPGVIDCHSHIAADSINESAVPVSSMVAIEDVLNPTTSRSTAPWPAGSPRRTSCTAAPTPSAASAWCSSCAGARRAKRCSSKAPSRESSSLSAKTRSAKAKAIHPGSRQGVNDVIRDAFLRAKAYQTHWRTYESEKANGEDGPFRRGAISSSSLWSRSSKASGSCTRTATAPTRSWR